MLTTRFVFAMLLVGPTLVFAESAEPTPEQAGKQLEALQATLPKLKAAYVKRVAEARKGLDAAHKKFESDKDAQAWEAAIHTYNWSISDDAALGDVRKAIYDLVQLIRIVHNTGQPPGPHTESRFKQTLEIHRWFESLVWSNLAERSLPFATPDRGYLKKKTVKLAMCGDSNTMRMRCEHTMLDHLDSRFELLNGGRSGATIGSWFSPTQTQFDIVKAYNPDVIVMMLGTNGVHEAFGSQPLKGQLERERTLAAYRKSLQSLRDLPSKPVVILASLPPMGIHGNYPCIPSMNEMIAHLAVIDQYPYIDTTRALNGLVSELPTGSSWTPNRKNVEKWSHIGDTLHPIYGPSLAKYYGLVCRQILEPERWYDVTVRCSAVEGGDWKEPWLVARATRDPVRSPDRARGISVVDADGKWTFETVTKPGGPQQVADGEVSFIRPKTGGRFYLPSGRSMTFTFGRPHLLVSETPPGGADATFPATYSISGSVTRGDGKPVAGVALKLGETSTKTDDQGRFTFADLTGNPVDKPLVIAALP